jgi:hypothetical protein
MDGYNQYPPAQDFATGGQSLAVKGGVAGSPLSASCFHNLCVPQEP